MGKEITKDEVIKQKKQVIKKLDRTFETLINSPNPKHLKKANLIAYWLDTFTSYTLEEEKYDYSKIPKYQRGDVIRLNFGFNVGSEHGGLHYAIVLDNNNKKSSKVITVIPLSSGTEEETHERDIFLGNELYDKLSNKYNILKSDVELRKAENKKIIELISYLDSSLKRFGSINGTTVDTTTPNEKLMNVKKEFEERIIQTEKDEETIQRYEREVDKLKSGSIALMEQITTVSKIRIHSPKKSIDLLHGIKFSNGAMNKINEQLKKLYVFENNC